MNTVRKRGLFMGFKKSKLGKHLYSPKADGVHVCKSVILQLIARDRKSPSGLFDFHPYTKRTQDGISWSEESQFSKIIPDSSRDRH
jgi:hypothetical protein